MPFPVQRVITENKSARRAERRGEVLLCSCVCVKNTTLPLPWRLQRNKIKGVSVSTPKCENLPPETREERDCKGRMERSVREKCREWRHCRGDRRVIWVRWTEWWYVKKGWRTLKRRSERGRGGGEIAIVQHLTPLQKTPCQLVNHKGSVDWFSPILNQVLKRVLLLFFLCLPDSFSSPSLYLSDSFLIQNITLSFDTYQSET